jgi:hypothetical protein
VNKKFISPESSTDWSKFVGAAFSAWIRSGNKQEWEKISTKITGGAVGWMELEREFENDTCFTGVTIEYGNQNVKHTRSIANIVGDTLPKIPNRPNSRS